MGGRGFALESLTVRWRQSHHQCHVRDLDLAGPDLVGLETFGGGGSCPSVGRSVSAWS